MDELLKNNWYWFCVISLLGGTLSGALGVGGGVFIVPALVIGLGLTQKVAQGTCLALMVPMALMGAIRYHLNPDIRMSLWVILIMIPCGIIGANIGSSIAAWLPDIVLKRIFGAFVVIVGIKMILVKG